MSSQQVPLPGGKGANVYVTGPISYLKPKHLLDIYFPDLFFFFFVYFYCNSVDVGLRCGFMEIELKEILRTVFSILLRLWSMLLGLFLLGFFLLVERNLGAF